MMAGALLTGCGGSDNNSGPSQSTNSSDTSASKGGDTTNPSTTSGSDSNGASGSYCDDLKSAKATVEAFGGANMNQASFDVLTGVLHNIADEAPADVSDDWNTLGDAIDSISLALQKAGISFDDLSKMGQPGGPTLDPADLQALETALQGMDATGLDKASKAIDTEVKNDCGFALGVGG
jgi:hypothetical protein